jgi:modulator of FtsH protease
VAAYDPSQWTDFFVAAAGGSAALAGLVFVAVSINLQRILEFEGLPERALETLMLLLSVLLVSLLCLVPGQSEVALGVELAVSVGAILAVTVRLPTIRADRSGEEQRAWLLARWGVRGLSLGAMVLAGISVAAGSGGGLYWLLAGVVFAIAGGVASAWVLLVEIMR